MKTLRTFVLMLAAAAMLSSCGFTLRGSGGDYSMPFRSIYLAFPETSSLGTELRRNLRGSDRVDVVSDPAKADARFDVISENRGKSILSLNSQGRVREYLLTYTLVFRVSDAKGGPRPGIDISDGSAMQELDDLEYVARMKRFK